MIFFAWNVRWILISILQKYKKKKFININKYFIRLNELRVLFKFNEA